MSSADAPGFSPSGLDAQPARTNAASTQIVLSRFIPASSGSGFDDVEGSGHLRGLGEHGTGRAVLIVRQLDGPRHRGFAQTLATDGEVHVNAGKALRFRLGAVGVELHHAGA